MIAIECPCFVPANGAPEWHATVAPLVVLGILAALAFAALVTLMWGVDRIRTRGGDDIELLANHDRTHDAGTAPSTGPRGVR